MNARYFDIDNFLITAKDIRGPWSKPVYLHSAGFDASILHDDDGKKYVVSLDWETRDGYEKPGAICMAEYDPARRKIIGCPKRIWRGGTNRGCLEAPHLTKHNSYYYLMCAEGGTGYYHCITIFAAFRSFVADENIKIFHDSQPHGLTDCFGMTYNQHTRPVNVTVAGAEARYWMELLNPTTAETMAHYEHKYWGKYAAITRNAFGKGWA